MSVEKVQPYYLAKGKELTDMLFDKDFLNQELDRESSRKLDDFFGYLFQMYCESAVKVSKLSARMKDLKKEKPTSQMPESFNTADNKTLQVVSVSTAEEVIHGNSYPQLIFVSDVLTNTKINVRYKLDM